VLRAEVALHVRAATELTRASFDYLFGAGDAARIASARLACVNARQRVEEALAAYAGERGRKRVPLARWTPLVRIPIAIDVADDTLVALRHAGYNTAGCSVAAQQVEQAARLVCRSFEEWAERLDDPRRAPDPALRAAIADLDMVAGTGRQRAEIAAATGACLDASRADSQVLHWLMGLSWATLWLGYIAHLRALAEAPLDEVTAAADAPWWR